MRDKLILNHNDIERIPFLVKLDNTITSVLKEEGLNDVDYLIWGGVAVNILFQHVKLTNHFYSYHDIELALVKNGEVVFFAGAIEKIREKLLNKANYGLNIGGLEILKRVHAKQIDTWQNVRINNCDGDLEIHNIILICSRTKVYFDAPYETINRIIDADYDIRPKNHSELLSISRLSRRIYRTISKTIRLTLICEQIRIESVKTQVETLLDQISMRFNDSESSQASDGDIHWLKKESIESEYEIFEWVYKKTVSETIKRVFGLGTMSFLELPRTLSAFFTNGYLVPSIKNIDLLMTIENRCMIYNNKHIHFSIHEIDNILIESRSYELGASKNLSRKFSIFE